MERAVIQRIKHLSKCNNMNDAEFAKRIGIAQTTYSNILNRNSDVKHSILELILNSFGDLSSDWLMRGEGKMFKSEKECETTKGNLTTDSSLEYKPRIPYEAAAGTLAAAVDKVMSYHCEQIPVIAAFPKYDFTIQIKGNSMEPKYEGGDEVACKRVDDTSFIQWGRTHVLDTAQGVVVKRLYDAGDHFRCVSYNSVEYPEFLIHRSEVFSIYIVVGLLRM